MTKTDGSLSFTEMIPRFCILSFILAACASFCAGSVHGDIPRGDEAHLRKDHAGAAAAFEHVIEQDPGNYEALWRLARENSDLGAAAGNPKQKQDFFLKGVVYAEKAVAANSEGSKGRLYKAICLGRMAGLKGAKEKIRLSHVIRTEAEAAVRLDPREHLAWHILGNWHRELSSLSWIERKFADIFLGGIPKDASLDRAVECFRKAIEIQPDAIAHHLELAVTYERMDMKEEAAAEYRIVLDLPLYDAADEARKGQARERLKKLRH